MLIVNGRVYPMDSPVQLNGWVLLEDGLIKGLGPMDALPPYLGERLDAAGAFVLPGLMDAHSHLGMWGDSLGFESADGNEDTDPVTPQLRAIDALNPMDRYFEEALHSGVTAVMTGPGSANPIGGQLAVVRTGGRRIDDMIIKAPGGMKMALGENPKTVYHGKNQAPVTRMATAAIIREALFKTRDYLRGKEKADADPDADAPDFDFKLESLIPVLKGELTVYFHAHRADDIFTAVRIAKEFNLKYAIIHATEGHLIDKELKDEGAVVITGPSFGDRCKPELKNLSFKTPGALTALGIPAAICTDHPVVPESSLMLCAALACREGMDELEAMRAVTLYGAMAAGVGGLLGSITPGKEADIVLYDRHPFETMSRVRAVLLRGERKL